MSTLKSLKAVLEEAMCYGEDDDMFREAPYPTIDDNVRQELSELERDHREFIVHIKQMMMGCKEDECKTSCEARIVKLKSDEAVYDDLMSKLLDEEGDLVDKVNSFPIPSYEDLLLEYFKNNTEFQSLKSKLSKIDVRQVEFEEKAHTILNQTKVITSLLKLVNFFEGDDEYNKLKTKISVTDDESEKERLTSGLQMKLKLKLKHID